MKKLLLTISLIITMFLSSCGTFQYSSGRTYNRDAPSAYEQYEAKQLQKAQLRETRAYKYSNHNKSKSKTK